MMKRMLVLVVFALLSITVQAQANVNVFYLWDTASENAVTLESDLPIWGARLNVDGSVIMAALQDGVLRVIDSATGEIISERRLEAERGGYNFPSFVDMRDPGFLIVIMSARFYVWSWADDRILLSGDTFNGLVVPDYGASRVLVARRDPPAVVIYDAFNPDQPLVVDLPARAQAAAWSGDYTRIAVIYDGGMRVIDSVSGEKLFELEDSRFGDAYSEALWSPDDQLLALQMTHSLDYEHSVVRVVDSVNGETIQEFASTNGIFSTEWSADGEYLLTAAYEGEGMRVFDVESGELVSQCGDSAHEYLWASLNGGESRIVSVGVAGGADVYAVWDAQTCENLFEMRFGIGADTLLWNDNRSMMYMSHFDGDYASYLFDPANPNETLRTLDHAADVLGAAWSLDGTHLVTWTGMPRG